MFLRVLSIIERARTELSYRRRLLEPLNLPFILQLEVTNACNLSCPMCPRTKHMTRKVEYMDFSFFQNVVDELAELNPRNGGKFLRLHHFGESLLHPHIGKFITYAESRGISTALSTNAIVLTSKRRSALLGNLTELIISFDGYSEEIYEKHRAGGDYHKAKIRVESFLEEKSDFDKPNVIVSTLVTPDTQNELRRYTSFWLEKGADKVRLKRAHDWDGKEDIAEFVTFEPRESKVPCRYPWESFVVLVDGRVVPCCRDYDGKFILGDLKEQTIRGIWYGNPYSVLRHKHAKGRRTEIALCSRCSCCPSTREGDVDRDYPLSTTRLGHIKEILRSL